MSQTYFDVDESAYYIYVIYTACSMYVVYIDTNDIDIYVSNMYRCICECILHMCDILHICDIYITYM